MRFSAMLLAGCTVVAATACQETMAPQPSRTIVRGLGQGQVGYAGTTLYQPLQVQIVDLPEKRAVPGATVNWTVIEGDGTLSATRSVSNSAGIAEVEWTMGPTPGVNRVVASLDTTGSVAFVGTGVAAPDCTHGCWLYGRPLPTLRSSIGAAAESGKILAVGGDRPGRFCRGESVLERYDVAADRWSDGAGLPTPRSNLAVAIANGKLYAMGGCGLDRVLGTNEEYDPLADRWTTRAPMQSPRYGLAGATLGDRIFAVGGGLLRSDAVVPDVESFDPATNEWRFHPSLPTPREGLALVALGGRLYAIGGYRREFEFATVEMYDPEQDRWFDRASLRLGAGAITAVVLDDRIYAMASWRREAAVEVYDALTDTWSQIMDIGVPRIHAAAASYAGRFYLIGGVEGLTGRPVGSLEIYSPGNARTADTAVGTLTISHTRAPDVTGRWRGR